MKTEEHLTLEDFLRLCVLPQEDDAVRRHLGECADCLVRFEQVQRGMRQESAAFRQQVQAMPESFWARQRHQIVLRVRSEREAKKPVWRFFDLRVWATAAAALIFSVALVQWTPREQGVALKTDVPWSDKDSWDDQLLLDVHEAIMQDHADPLRALELLVQIPEGPGQVAVPEQKKDGNS